MFTSPDSLAVAARSRFGLQPVPPSEIAPVDDDATCRRARDAYARELLALNPRIVISTDTARRVRDYRVGPDFVVLDPSFSQGEWYTMMIFTSDFTVGRAYWGM